LRRGDLTARKPHYQTRWRRDNRLACRRNFKESRDHLATRPPPSSAQRAGRSRAAGDDEPALLRMAGAQAATRQQQASPAPVIVDVSRRRWLGSGSASNQ
jgi:hypothetical protein